MSKSLAKTEVYSIKKYLDEKMEKDEKKSFLHHFSSLVKTKKAEIIAFLREETSNTNKDDNERFKRILELNDITMGFTPFSFKLPFHTIGDPLIIIVGSEYFEPEILLWELPMLFEFAPISIEEHLLGLFLNETEDSKETKETLEEKNYLKNQISDDAKNNFINLLSKEISTCNEECQKRKLIQKCISFLKE